jgi:hypothetical protein
MITKEQITEILNNHAGYMDRSRTEQAVHEDNFNDVADEILSKLSQHDVSKRKFAVEWIRNVNYGIGSGTEYFYAETREEALRLFWNGKNKEAFDVNTIYVC